VCSTLSIRPQSSVPYAIYHGRPNRYPRIAFAVMDADQEARRDLLSSLIQAARDPGVLEGYVQPPATAPEVAAALAPIAATAEADISWVGINTSRVDVGVNGPEDQEWRVVFITDDARTVTNLWVFERPLPFPGVPGGRAVIVNGPSGAGKSSLMNQIWSDDTTPWVLFDEVNYGLVKSPYLIWPDTAGPLHRGFVAGIAALAQAGNQVMLASSGLAQSVFRDAFRGVPTLYVGLDCPLEVLLERERGRDGRWGGLAAGSVGAHDGWTYDLLLDSYNLTLEQLADEVRRAIA
jgi:chloramphenicol 3-O phosphotransferase